MISSAVSRKKWLEETGSSWNQTETNQRLFQMMLKRSMPQEVQNALDEVVGLHNMEWKVFKDHVIHHVERHRKKKEQEKESNEKLATRLQQAQLNELKKKDKKKEDTANQAAVITPQVETITSKQQDQAMFTPQEQVITQAAVVTQPNPINQPNQVIQPGQVNQMIQPSQAINPQIMPSAQPIPVTTGMPPINVYVNGGPGNRGRGRGRNRGRGGPGRPISMPPMGIPPQIGNQQMPNMQGDQQYQQYPRPPIYCWTCGQPGHMSRNCTSGETSNQEWY